MQLAVGRFPPHAGSMTKPVLMAALALLAALSPAVAQTPAPSDGTDRALLSSCLRDTQDAPRACIGSIAIPCVRRAAEGARSEAEVSCAKRETTLWRERMDAASGVYSQALDSGQRSRFSALQRSWESYVAQKCAFAAEIQPAARMASMQTGCDLREVAGRAIEIELALRGRQGNTPATRRNQAPRIER